MTPGAKTFLVKMCFICMKIKNQFYIKGRELNLVLIKSPGGTRKWPIRHLSKEKWTETERRPAIVSGMVTGDAPVSYWQIVFPRL